MPDYVQVIQIVIVRKHEAHCGYNAFIEVHSGYSAFTEVHSG